MTACPACRSQTAPEFVERCFDRIGGQEYRLYRCPDCGVIFSEPRKLVGPDWYQKAAPLRATEWQSRPGDDWRYRQFFSENIPPGKLLDVGCGDGGFLLLAQQRGFSACGFDYEERMVDLALKRGLKDVRAAEFGEYCRGRDAGEFDAVTLFDVLEHTPEPAWFIDEIKRILKPGGIIAVTLPNAGRPLPWGREDHDYPPHHFTRWTSAALRRFLEQNGFDVLRLESSRLPVSYLADHFFYFVLMRKPLQWARRILFGIPSGQPISGFPDTTLGRSDLVSDTKRGWKSRLRTRFADKRSRQAAADFLKNIASPITYPFAAILVAYYRLSRKDCGNYLYILARLRK